ncbi:MAG: hypothetical protein CBC55_02560 [Gammaproteobacteria bacterium TMED95]|nr:MAG: hypothetical protein CBC55_02560 [Gammaproteobacteria bacterium TMED95]|tara:strand:+ start:2876 stop:3280 length:405 start_codon:yes stop_codon:yes gene_type:complete
MAKYVITDIEYDDGHPELPTTLTMVLDREMEKEELEHEASEFISKETGFCHTAFCVEIDKQPNAKPLLPFVVLHTVGTASVPKGAVFMAVDNDHAVELMESENPHANITWIVQTDDVEHAFDVYHKESTFEDVG